MDYSLMGGIGSYLVSGQNGGIGSYLTGSYLANPYLSGLTGLSGLYSGSSYLSSAGISSAFQSGVRFGQALEKAMEKNPESAEQMQNILKEAFGGQSQGSSTGVKTTQTGTAGNSRTTYSYGKASASERPYGPLGDYLTGRRESRVQQRLAGRQSEGRKLT